MNMGLDVRPVLPTIRVPTLVLHRTRDPLISVEVGRYVARTIPGARLVELPGEDHLNYVGDTEAIVSEIQEFLTGKRSEPEADRVLATVLFTDIVDSTKRAAALGDRRWRELLDAHDELAASLVVDRHRGRMVKSTGDGMLAIFDGPARAIRCALELRDGVDQLGLQIRCGLHTGEVELRGDDVGGIAVHIGARVAELAAANEVLVSRKVVDLVAGSGMAFGDRGSHAIKGIEGEWRLFTARSADGSRSQT
jgi:class 3 adenylate cyclase